MEIEAAVIPVRGRRRRFAENFARRNEIGAAVAVTIGGRPVVDLWAGHADALRTRPWERTRSCTFFSTTKGMTALCAHILADRGLLDLDAPVARYWAGVRRGREGTPSACAGC